MPSTERFAETEQEGVPHVVSPKAWAALVSSIVTAYLVGLAAKALGADIDIPTATAVLGPPVLGLVTFISTYCAHIGQKYLASVGLVDHKVDGPASDALLRTDPVAQRKVEGAATVEPEAPEYEDEPDLDRR